MIAFLRAHGVDPGPTQRPLLAGALTGLAATVPALIVFVSFGSFTVVADEILGLPRISTALLLIAAFTLSGVLYGFTFRRAANDRHGGWLFGAAFGFILWMVAPIIVLPVMSGHIMAAGTAAMGFLASFLVWGTVIGGLFPHIHRPLYMSMYARLGEQRSFGPVAAALQRGKEPQHKPAADQQ
jgi:hypothetical protein